MSKTIKTINYPKYLLIKVKKNLNSWTIWIFNTNHVIKKTLKVFSLRVTKNKLYLLYQPKTESMYKTHKTILENIFYGLASKYKVTLDLQGVGFSTKILKNNLEFNLGFSHKVLCKIPDFLKVELKKKKIYFEGYDLTKTHQFAWVLRNLKQPDSYKGKGFRFDGEFIALKQSNKSK